MSHKWRAVLLCAGRGSHLCIRRNLHVQRTHMCVCAFRDGRTRLSTTKSHLHKLNGRWSNFNWPAHVVHWGGLDALGVVTAQHVRELSLQPAGATRLSPAQHALLPPRRMRDTCILMHLTPAPAPRRQAAYGRGRKVHATLIPCNPACTSCWRHPCVRTLQAKSYCCLQNLNPSSSHVFRI